MRPLPPMRTVSQSERGPAMIGPVMPIAAESRPNCSAVAASDRWNSRTRKDGVKPITP